jgi:hypothetical protein
MYAVKHVNLMDAHIPPKKKANQALIVELVKVFGASFIDRNSGLTSANDKDSNKVSRELLYVRMRV